MQDPRIERMAKTLVQYSLELKVGDRFVIEGSELTAPLIRAVYREALKAGAHPEVLVSIPGLSEILLKEGNDDQLSYIPPIRRTLFEQYDAYLAIRGEYNSRSLSGVDPSRQAIRARAGAELTKTFMSRSASGELRWCGTQFPTHSGAQDANMSSSDYEEFVFKACRVDGDHDPVEAWRKVNDDQDEIVRKISKHKTLRIVGDGTDLTLDVGGRTWINASGKANFPDGEIFTGPVEDSANGSIRFSFPAIYAGKEVEDIRLTFEQGRVVDARASKGEDLLRQLLVTDQGASYLGEIGIGTNFEINRFTRNMLFDEKIGGTVHLAVGAGYPETGSTNQSGIHWDMLCDLRDGGEIYGDGELIYKEGKFLI